MTAASFPVEEAEVQRVRQPLNASATRLVVEDAANHALYDPQRGVTSAPIVPDSSPGRAFEPHETLGWKDVIRVDPGEVVSVAVRFDVPGRYVYHCHVVEHEDREMMRPFVVSVVPMGMDMPMRSAR